MDPFLSSDLHLGHAKILELSPRNFRTVEEMTETLIRNWNEEVTDSDLVYFLGDVFLGPVDVGLKYIQRLNGHKILISGNHDRPSKMYPHGKNESRNILKREMWRQKYMDAGFAEVVDSAESNPIIYFQDIPLKLSHLPYSGDHTSEDRFIEFRPKDTGEILLHGHVHDKWRFKGRMINVGVDVWDFKPVRLSTLMQNYREAVCLARQ